jgi:hypothetical protein
MKKIFIICPVRNITEKEKEILNKYVKKLEKLNKNNYSGFSGKILLLCTLESPLTTDKSIEKDLKQYTTFKSDDYFKNYFHEIWITWKSNNSGLLRIKKIE